MRIHFTILLFMMAINLLAQTVIKGTVKDEKGQSIAGANIFLSDTYDGTTSDAEGNFQFDSHESGLHLLTIKFIGYKDFTKEVDLDGKTIPIDAVLRETINELDAVTITAGSFTASDESRRTVFKPVDIATTAGATADIAGALNTLPGTQKVGESGRLFVRGGDGNEARTFIDGMLVLNPYNSSAPNTPSRSRFLPFMFKGTSFSTGGYSAEYGQALSSTLVLDSKDKSESTRTDFGLLSVGGDVSHTHVWDRASLAGKIQYTNIRPYFNLINQEIDWITPPESLEGSAAFRHNVGKAGMFKAYGNFKRTDYSMYNHDIDDPSKKQLFDITNDYQYINLAYKDILTKDWTIRGGLSYTFMGDDLLDGGDKINEREKGRHGKVVLEGSPSEQVELMAGAEIIDRSYDYQVSHPDHEYREEEFNEIITSTFVEGSVYLSNHFVTRGGARLEYNNLLRTASIDPRLSLAYKVGDGNFSVAYGKFRQSPANELLRMNLSVNPEKADHYILSYQLVDNNRTFRAEAYYKQYRDLVKYVNLEKTLINNSGTGYAKGFELFWRDNRSIRNLDYWISYSYLDTKREYLDFPYKATPSFASAHNFSFVYKYFFTKLKTQFGATYSFTSGRPYNDPNREIFNGSKTRSYQDLSINLAYLPRHNLILYFSATNLTGRDNVFGYEFSNQLNDNGYYNSRAIKQPAKHFLFLGIFITLSKEQSINQLPTL
ncbi:MAG TPA: TonB-dependent receptor [Cyclobacteriaceae bacterium]|nr:TonB-dependent receptor [Cyclobacteriaceae bacterium]